jgi:hypothetical protein
MTAEAKKIMLWLSAIVTPPEYERDIKEVDASKI